MMFELMRLVDLYFISKLISYQLTQALPIHVMDSLLQSNHHFDMAKSLSCTPNTVVVKSVWSLILVQESFNCIALTN